MLRFNHTDFYSMMASGGGRNSNFGASDVYGLSATSRGLTPRPSKLEMESQKLCHQQVWWQGLYWLWFGGNLSEIQTLTLV